MFKQVGVDVVELTKDYVVEFTNLPTYGGDRDRATASGKRRIAWLEQKLDEGTFYSPVWATATLNGVLYRVDGGHSSAMLSSVNGSFPKGQTAIIRRFHCENDMDMAYLFDQFDHKKSTRTAGDKINAHKAIESELQDISKSKIGYAIAGIAYWLSGCGEDRAIDEDERVALMHEHTEFVRWATRRFRTRAVTRVGVVAAMYATYTKSRQSASVFWDSVIDATSPDPKSPTRKLNAFLITADDKNWTPRAFCVKSLHAWNAWKNCGSTMLKYIERSGIPKIS